MSADGKRKETRSYSLPEYQSWECPKSVLQDGQGYEYVRKFQLAKRQKQSLTKLLDDRSPFIEDVEEVLREAEMIVKAARLEEMNR